MEIGPEGAQFPEKEYINRIFVAVQLVPAVALLVAFFSVMVVLLVHCFSLIELHCFSTTVMHCFSVMVLHFCSTLVGDTGTRRRLALLLHLVHTLCVKHWHWHSFSGSPWHFSSGAVVT